MQRDSVIVQRWQTRPSGQFKLRLLAIRLRKPRAQIFSPPPCPPSLFRDPHLHPTPLLEHKCVGMFSSETWPKCSIAAHQFTTATGLRLTQPSNAEEVPSACAYECDNVATRAVEIFDSKLAEVSYCCATHTNTQQRRSSDRRMLKKFPQCLCL